MQLWARKENKMSGDWQEMDNAPRKEAVIICCANCELYIAHQIEGELYDAEAQKSKKQWYWKPIYSWGSQQGFPVLKPKMWQPLPMPPKHLYERKLAADILEKQVAELRK